MSQIRNCKNCNETLKVTRLDGRAKEFCSSQCKSRFHYLQKRELKSKQILCQICGRSFVGPSYKKYCSSSCATDASNASRRKWPKDSRPVNLRLLGESPLIEELAPQQSIPVEQIQHLPSHSPVKLNWVCKKDERHIWTASVRSRTKGSNCLVCKGNVVIKGVNDLASVRPDLLAFWDFSLNALGPDQITINSRKICNWKCEHGHLWSTRPAALTRGLRCPYCAGQRVDKSNALATLAPDLAGEWDFTKNILTPEQVVPRSGREVFWVCDQGHSYQARVISRYLRKTGCPICSGRILLIGFNDLQTRFPDIALEWSTKNPLAPSEIGHGSTQKAIWVCSECSFEWSAKVVNRTIGSGCPACAKTGFDPSKKGYLYLLAKEHLGYQQFGLMNVPKRRLATHKKAGWEILDVVGPSDGIWVQQTEVAIKSFFRSRGTLLDRNTNDKFVGYTETWLCDGIEFHSISELLSALRQSEND